MKITNIKCDRCGAICNSAVITNVEIIAGGNGALRGPIVAGKDFCRNCYFVIIAAIRAAATSDGQ